MEVKLNVPLMTKNKFADETGLPVSSLNKLIDSGLIPAIVFSERNTVVNLVVLAERCAQFGATNAINQAAFFEKALSPQTAN